MNEEDGCKFMFIDILFRPAVNCGKESELLGEI